MTYYNNTLCVPYSELVGNGYLTETQYRNYTNRNKISIVRRGCRNTEALISFESLPTDIKHELSKKHVDIEMKAKLEPIKKLIVNDYKVGDIPKVATFFFYKVATYYALKYAPNSA